MHRTTIMLPADLRRRAQRRAQQEGLSLAELIRQALEESLRESRGGRAQDSFFADNAVFHGEDGPTDVALNHDKYLYDYDP